MLSIVLYPIIWFSTEVISLFECIELKNKIEIFDISIFNSLFWIKRKFTVGFGKAFGLRENCFFFKFQYKNINLKIANLYTSWRCFSFGKKQKKCVSLLFLWVIILLFFSHLIFLIDKRNLIDKRIFQYTRTIKNF